MANLPHFKLTVGELDEEENIFMTSLVSDPATNRMLASFNGDKQSTVSNHKFAQMPSTEKYERVISGVWMMPDTKYFRVYNGFEFTVSFDKPELKKALIQYLKNNDSNNFDIEHSGDKINGLVSIEHWIVNDKDTRSPIMGYSLADLGYTKDEIPVGTVMKTVYIEDETFFNDMILSGDVMGYSIEGFFNLSEDMINTMEEANEQFTKVGQMFNKLGLVQSKGTIITTEGSLMFSKDTITLNEVTVEDGEYKTNFGFNIVIRENRVVDFGFEEVAQAVVDSTEVVTQVQVDTQTDVVTVQNDTQVEDQVEQTTNTNVQVETEAVNTDSEVTNQVNDNKDMTELIKQLVSKEVSTIKTELNDKDKLIKELTDKLAAETVAKETAIKSSAVPLVQNNNNKPADYSPDKFNVRKKNGITYYIPKR